mgnify:CR=1 FL=1
MASAPRLDVFQARHAFHVAWVVDGDKGLQLGDDAEDDEHRVASKAVASTPGAHKSVRGFEWPTLSEATHALSLARAALRSHRSKKPWPEWALTAVANGWKAPRGWTP